MVSLAAAGANFYLPAREWIVDHLTSDRREVLGIATGTLGPEKSQLTVVKVKSGKKLQLEVYTWDKRLQTTHLKNRLTLSEPRDGYFMFQGNATNLALADIDGDGFSEIITANFDKDLIPRLRVFKWNPQSEVFDSLDSRYWPF